MCAVGVRKFWLRLEKFAAAERLGRSLPEKVVVVVTNFLTKNLKAAASIKFMTKIHIIAVEVIIIK